MIWGYPHFRKPPYHVTYHFVYLWFDGFTNHPDSMGRIGTSARSLRNVWQAMLVRRIWYAFSWHQSIAVLLTFNEARHYGLLLTHAWLAWGYHGVAFEQHMISVYRC